MLRRITHRKRTIFIVIALLCVFAVSEIILSFILKDAPSVDRLRFNLNPLANKELYLYDPVLFWRLRPGAVDEGAKINAQGMRGVAAKKKRTPGVTRILLLGDSVVYGFKLDDRDGIAANLRRILGKEGAVEVINAGVVGYSSFQVMNYFRQELSAFKPDIVVTYVGNNDWLESPTFQDKKQPVLIGPVGKSWHVLRRLALYRALRMCLGKSGLFERGAKSADSHVRRVTPDDYQYNLRMIQKEAVKIGAKAYFCRMVQIAGDPPCVRDGYYPIPEDLTLIDMLEPFRGLCLPRARRYFMDGVHPTPKGAHLMAEAIAEKIAESINAR